MSLVDADEVPDARSFCSRRRTASPRPAASRAMAVPLMPPPITARSKSATAIASFQKAYAPRGLPLYVRLVVLRQKTRRLFLLNLLTQYGHLGSILAIATIKR